ncbi:PIN domain [Moraxella lacunata]|uniref:PIN domain n=1 Tax=Moraxella lacunata TaxID=477 RepID=A0A378TT01_MORLA|nr:PIN domain-containing protein [Moraxella lacunata]STZ63959.1 PIN domain [Moraxella lacunata]
MIFQNDVYLDTHAVVWLYTGQLKKFSKNTLDILENNNLFISPMVKLELQYLYEKQRITDTAEQIINALNNEIDLNICQKNWIDVVNVALTCDFTRDAFDRLIVAHAMLDDNILISKDTNLTEHCKNCVW